MDVLRRFVRQALAYVGAPYIWGGNGLEVFNVATLKLERHQHRVGNLLVNVFDCCGLVNVSLHLTGGPDWRGKKNAQTLFDDLVPAEQLLGMGHLLFYGPHQSRVTHVAICLGVDGWIVEAAGGDQRNTRLPSSGSVRVRGWNERGDLLGARKLPPFTTSH